jgi:uracil-DNA glycosylase family 4
VKASADYNRNCRDCPRLVSHLDAVRRQHPEYHCAPVPPFGDPEARLLIVGLAPGMHGANATGRPFTGDHAGILLYETLYKFGFSSAPASRHRQDGLTLRNCRVTNAVKCLPPQNKPIGAEVSNCRQYLSHELDGLEKGAVIVALGAVAHRAVVTCAGLRHSSVPFGHGARSNLPNGRVLLSSYHCSRYNTQTRRLSTEMFEAVFRQAARILDTAASSR